MVAITLKAVGQHDAGESAIQCGPFGVWMGSRRGGTAVADRENSLLIGMVGGGEGAFIGGVHRAALALDGKFQLVAGAFSSTEERSQRSAVALGLPKERGFKDLPAMVQGMAQTPLQAVAIVTPNFLHCSQVVAAADAGLAIFCEKPLACTLDEARIMASAVSKAGVPFAVAHVYSGYPMVAQARHLVASGALGHIRRADVAYLQGWLAQPIERGGQKQAGWRTDPKLAGAGASGDIATHAHHLLEHVTGDRLARLSARQSILVAGRQIDDDVSMLGAMASGAAVTLTASQIAIGRANGLTLALYGDKASLMWQQEEPDTLWFCPDGEPEQRWIAGSDKAYLTEEARSLCRTPSGHPRGFIESFANLYRAFADEIVSGQSSNNFPGLQEAVRGMAFLDALAKSSAAHGQWTDIEDVGL
jgi:predicted dehydrogenase